MIDYFDLRQLLSTKSNITTYKKPSILALKTEQNTRFMKTEDAVTTDIPWCEPER